MIYGELVDKFTEIVYSSMESQQIEKELFALFKDAHKDIKNWTEQEFYMDVYTKMFPPRNEQTAARWEHMQRRFDMYTTMFSSWWYLVIHCDFRYNLRGEVEIF